MFMMGSQRPSGYSIMNSVRLDGTAAYLSKTLTTSATTSGSVWVKRSKLGAVSPIFDNKVYFTAGDALYAFGLTSTALYRDPSAWMHIFWNGTGVYVNGTLVTGTGAYTAASVTNPRLGYDGTNFFSGYLSDFAFWNGTSASLQGGVADTNGVWAARKPAAGYSFLAFGSAGALGTDTSGNGNTWTVTGSPVQTTDTPTCNYATLSPLTPSVGSGLSNGAMTIWSTASHAYFPATQAVPSNGSPTYFEMTITAFGNYGAGWGLTSNPNVAWAGTTQSDAATYWFYLNPSAPSTAVANSAGTSGNTQAAIPSYTPALNDVWGVAYNPSTGAVYANIGGQWRWYASGWQSSATFAGASPIFTVSAANIAAGMLPMLEGTDKSLTANFGQRAFSLTVPTGYKSLCSANLPSVAVTTSGTFTGNANADGPFVWTNGNPATLTINGNAVTFGTHADKTAGGFKLRSSSASYNTSGSNTWTATAGKRFVYSATSINTAQGNP